MVITIIHFYFIPMQRLLTNSEIHRNDCPIKFQISSKLYILLTALLKLSEKCAVVSIALFVLAKMK